MTMYEDETVEIKSDSEGEVSIQVEGDSDVVFLSRDDALQVAYALMAVTAGQGPSFIRVRGGKRVRVD